MTDDTPMGVQPPHDPAKASPKPPQMRLWLRVVLFGSLAVNLLILGAVVGMMATHDGSDRRRGVPRVDQMGGPLTHALSPEDRRAIGRQIWREYRQERPSRREMAAEYGAVITALRAEPFVPEVVERSLDRQLRTATDRQAIGHRVLLERLTGMTPAERAGFADRLEQGMQRMQERPPKKD